tara:strand:- start:645 stop:995 length:351 start_codon:yes stop_codon:yes gene_type:complete
MKNIKAHVTIPGLTVKAILVGSAVALTFMLATGRNVPTNFLVGFAALVFFAQFLNMMLGMNPLGMIIGMIVSVFALIMLKTLYSFPTSWLGVFFTNSMVVIAPVIAGIDIIRDLID